MDKFLWREILRNLVLPPGGQLLLIIAGWWCLRRWRRVGAALLGTGVVTLWLLATPAIADLLEHAVERYPALDLSQPTGAQAVVILSADVRSVAPEYGSDAPGMETLQRLAYGALVARRTQLPVLVSGGVVRTQQSLAATMRDSLARDFATPVRWLEDRSLDTHENALYSAAMLHSAGVQRIVLVTSANHEWRSVAEFEAAGMKVVPAPVGLSSESKGSMRLWLVGASSLARSRQALYEALGEAVRRMRGVRN
jgi:uncharacterized SAM-binding protein YcdF (DUF218 family)